MFVNTTCPDFQQQYRLKFSQYLRNYSCRPSGYHISKVKTYIAVQYCGGPRTLTSLNICCLTQPSRFRSHHGILKVQGSIAAAIIVIIIAIAACGLATFFLMRMRSRRMNQVYTPLLLTL